MNEQQQFEVAGIVDTWYYEVKGQFPDVPHPLGRCKEDLKKQLCEWVEKQDMDRPKIVCSTCKKNIAIRPRIPEGKWECINCRDKTGNCRICGVNRNDCCC